jgi:nitroimidazol reductase NimA-like FMN-containing flavoprotein (pyridoxamine 5'-phosphate oxidase superfamily)
MTKLDLSLTPEEVEDYLASQPTVRLATVTAEGRPHVVPLWFVWLEDTAFMNTTLGNLTVRNLQRDPEATGCVDDGERYDDLRGVLLHGRVERADEDPRIPAAERLWSEKYLAGNPVPFGTWRNRAWFRLRPERITSWDFGKIAGSRAGARRSRG